MYKFSQLSIKRLSTCHNDLIMVANNAIGGSPYDFKITEGHRSPQRQFELFKQGRECVEGKWVIVNKSKVVTNIDGVNKMGNHNYTPARAFDIQVLVGGKGTWVAKYYYAVSKHIMSIADQLFLEGRISHRIKWGGNFKSIVDLPHYEIIIQKP